MFKSMDEQMSHTLKAIVAISHKVNKPCPKCHHMTLVQPGPINKATGRPIVAPVCYYPDCGWRENAEDYTRRHRKEASNMARQMRYNTALGYFMDNSVQADSRDINNKTFKTFKTGTHANLQDVKKKAIKVASQIADDEPVHSLFVGNTGTGKTHLAYGVINYILKKTSYRKNILLLNMLNLSILQKKAIDDEESRKWFNHLLSQIDDADLVVIDDLGRERDNKWNQLIVGLIAGDRAKKPLLMTSNLQNGLDRYSQQIQDRLLPNRTNSVNFMGLSSYRPQASREAMTNAELSAELNKGIQ